MDKNTYTGFFLIVLIIIGSYFLLRPSEAELKKEKLVQDSIKRAAATKAVTPIKTDSVKKTVATVADSALLKTPFGAATIGSQKFVTLENKELRVKLSTQGGRVYSVELKNYKTADKKPLILFDGDKNQFGLMLNIPGKNINTNDLFFTPSAEALTVAEKDSRSSM